MCSRVNVTCPEAGKLGSEALGHVHEVVAVHSASGGSE
jgi:hypothetical protein